MSPLMRMIYGYRPGNKDLQSIEVALNNLLARMQESKLQQARFVSDASHELRTPISVIQGLCKTCSTAGAKKMKQC